jgi:hypothetical protein
LSDHRREYYMDRCSGFWERSCSGGGESREGLRRPISGR